jgi:hypothetical protein
LLRENALLVVGGRIFEEGAVFLPHIRVLTGRRPANCESLKIPGSTFCPPHRKWGGKGGRGGEKGEEKEKKERGEERFLFKDSDRRTGENNVPRPLRQMSSNILREIR